MSVAVADASDLTNQYRSELDLLSGMIAQSGVIVTPYHFEGLQAFSHQPTEFMEAKVSELKQLNALYLSVIEREKGSDYSDHQMAWAALRILGMRPLSDVFSLITEQDSIEIFNANHQQLFRSFNSFRCFSYTLDEMSQNEWWKLFERDDRLTARMFEVANSVLSQKVPATILAPFEPHWVKEKFSARQNRALLESRLITPLMSTSGSREIVGYLSVIRVVKLESMGVQPSDV
jgi:hypothetical protein